MADISKITLPSGTSYDIKDAVARANITALSGALTYLGETTTAITDGSTTTPVTIGGKAVIPKAGNVVIYGKSEFVWSDTESKWREFGSTGSLKALAFKDSASTSYKPAGTISAPTFTGTQKNITVKGTPTGTVSAPTISVTPKTASIEPFGSAGTLPSCTLPTMAATVENETLTLSWTAGSFSAGTLPTAGTAVTVATGIQSATASAPTFTGAEFESTGTITPTGTISAPTFTGTSATITVS